MIIIEIVYVSPNKQKLLTIKMPQGSKIIEAIQQSGILQAFPEIDLEKNKVGIFGKLADLNALLSDKDRIEIYRPLLIDPKQARLNRAKKI